MWIIGAALIALAIVVRVKIKKFKEVPETKFQNIMEAIVENFDNYATSILTSKYKYFGTWFFGVFMFFLAANLIGITGLRNPTADLSVTFSMGLTTVVLMQFVGFRYNGIQHVKEWFKPIFFFAPIHIIADLSRAVSLGMRLFINILSGLILIALIYFLLPPFLSIAIPGALALFFDIFIGVLQAFIFVTVSMFFLMMKAPQED
jgi:F-type H+-transporting ATPase subunit a